MRFELDARPLSRDPQGAIRAFRSYAEFVEPRDWTAHAYAGEAYACLGRKAPALSQFKQALACAPAGERAGALAWLGQILLWFGLYRKALEVEESACAAGARYGYCWRGVAKAALGDLLGALPDFEKAVELKPWDSEALVWRGEVLRRLGRGREAEEVLERALAEGGNVWARWNLALCRAARGDVAGTLKDYEAIAAQQSRELAYVRRAMGLRPGARAEADEAAAVLEEGLRLDPVVRDPQSHKARAWMRGRAQSPSRVRL